MNARWFPGYNVAAVSTLAMVLTAPGQTMLVSLLNVPFREAFGMQPLVLNLSYTVATVLASLPLVWFGKVTDRIGPRKMLIYVAFAFAAACFFTASVAHVAMVFIAFFLLRCLGQGALSLVSHHALAMWFHRRLGTISGIRQVAIFAAWAPLPTVTLLLIQRIGWRSTWVLFGVCIASLVSLASWLFLRDRPEDLGLAMDGDAPDEQHEQGTEWGLSLAEARQERSYWLLVAASLLPPMIGTAILFDIQPLLTGQGVSAESAAQAVSVWSGTVALLALPIGRLVDKLEARWLILVGTLSMAVSCTLLLMIDGERTAFAAMMAYGLGQSLVASAIGAAAARYFGRRHHGSIRSSLSRVGVVATGLGPLVFGASLRLSGDYAAALIGFAGLCLPMAVLILWLSPPPQPA